MLKYRKFLIIFLAAAYFCAILSGIFNLFPGLFSKATPFFLLLVSIICLGEYTWNRSFFLFFVVTFAGLVAVEILGVKTGFPFGHYSYTQLLGASVGGVPVIIGLNWVIVILGARQTVELFGNTWNKWLKSVFSGMICMVFDIVLELAVLKLDYWRWRSEIIPLQNYLSWFILSFIFSLLLNEAGRHNYLGRVNLLFQVIFFILIAIFAA